MNTAGNLGGWVCTVVFGYVVQGDGRLQPAAAGRLRHGAGWRRCCSATVDCTQGHSVLEVEAARA